MNKKIIKLSIFLLFNYFLIFPKFAYAVIPPDFIFNIGTQIAQFFSIIVIFFTAVFGTLFQFFRTRFYAIKHKKITVFTITFFIIATSLGSSFFYATYKQKNEYRKWLEESKKNNDSQGTVIDYKNKTEVDISDSNELKEIKDENDQLQIGNENNENIDLSFEKFVSKVSLVDDSSNFIASYYENIAKGDFELAYEMSKKSVDYETFKNWYLETDKITLDKLVRIDEKKSSIELTLYEKNTFTRYGVLMTLDLQESMLPVKVEKSEVKILAQGMIENGNISTDDNKISKEYGFFDNNSNRNIILTNQEFKTITDGGKDDYFVLDARENIEYENGYFPGSSHIRFADLKAGRWIELPKDKFIYVICWSGIRGKEVAEFLKTKKIVASYLENGANGWVEFGGKWIGNIKFGEQYNDLKYQIVFKTNEIKGKIEEGVILVDTREPYKFKKWHINGSINVPIMYTPTIEIEKVFAQVPPLSKIITICDGYVNCFDAKITGVELERRGHEFLGRYNKPWEYEE